MKTSILTKDYKIRACIYELLKPMALAIHDVSIMYHGYIGNNAKLQLKYISGSGKWRRVNTRLHDAMIKLLVKHSIPYALDNDAPRGGEIGDYIKVSALDLSKLIQTLKESAMLYKEQYSALSPNSRRYYITSMYKLGAMSAGDLNILMQLLLPDDCDKIAERVMQNPIESKIYFLEVNTNE